MGLASLPPEAHQEPSGDIVTVPCVPPAARTPRPCSGILMMASTCTPWTTQTQLTHFASLPTATGCAPLPAPASRSGIWKARTWSKSSAPRLLEDLPALLDLLSACQWLGLLMVRRYLQVTLITLFASGKSPSLLPAKIPTVVLLCI